MSGHSKWAQIKRSKGTADAKKGVLFTKLSNMITIAAREAGGDLDVNFKLKLAVDKAKKSNMPKENIERAIKHGTGESGGNNVKEVLYEAFGPGGVGLLIQTMTDNKNRVVASLKHILSKYGGSLSGSNSVQWMFKLKGIIRVPQREITNRESLELELIEQGVEDIQVEDEELLIFTQPEDLQKIESYCRGKNLTIDYAEIEWFAKEPIKIDQDVQAKIDRLYEELDENLDVNDYYSNIG